jgi:hypothetical protein
LVVLAIFMKVGARRTGAPDAPMFAPPQEELNMANQVTFVVVLDDPSPIVAAELATRLTDLSREFHATLTITHPNPSGQQGKPAKRAQKGQGSQLDQQLTGFRNLAKKVLGPQTGEQLADDLAAGKPVSGRLQSVSDALKRKKLLEFEERIARMQARSRPPTPAPNVSSGRSTSRPSTPAQHQQGPVQHDSRPATPEANAILQPLFKAAGLDEERLGENVEDRLHDEEELDVEEEFEEENLDDEEEDGVGGLGVVPIKTRGGKARNNRRLDDESE